MKIKGKGAMPYLTNTYLHLIIIYGLDDIT